MKTYLSYSFILAAAACGLATGQTAYTTPVGYVSQTCLPASDTIVGLPLRIAAGAAGALASSPDLVTTPGSAVLTLLGTPGLTANAFQGTHFVKFTSGGSEGKFYTVSSNTVSTITIALNGDTLAALTGNTLIVSKFWTLGELFVPAASTTDPATTGNAVVVTSQILAKKTEILLPNVSAVGVNPSSIGIYFVLNGAWRKNGASLTTSFDNTQLWPDKYFTIRQPALASATTYTVSGEVELGKMGINLVTQNSVKQDNVVSIPRPVDVTLNQLALGGTAAFMTTTSTLAKNDELLVFDNALAKKNRSASAIYFYYSGAWRKTGAPITTDFGTDTIKAGAGFIVRKAKVAGGPTVFWNNLAPY
jgi:uncharacterized protein (TIGR02597 family)